MPNNFQGNIFLNFHLKQKIEWDCFNSLDSFDITMAWKTSCKDVATRVGRFALHIFLLGSWGRQLLPPALLKWRPCVGVFVRWKLRNFLNGTTQLTDQQNLFNSGVRGNFNIIHFIYRHHVWKISQSKISRFFTGSSRLRELDKY